MDNLIKEQIKFKINDIDKLFSEDEAKSLGAKWNPKLKNLDIGFGSEDHLIEKYAQKFNF